MNSFKKFTYALVALILIVLVGWVVEENYAIIFSKHVSGVIVDVQRVNSTVAVVGAQGATDSAMFAFAIAVRNHDGMIFASSTDDRRWAVAKPGFCADATFYPFPPWNLTQAGTYRSARLNQLRDCSPSERGEAATVGASAGAATAGEPTKNPIALPQATPNAGGIPNGTLPPTQAQ